MQKTIAAAVGALIAGWLVKWLYGYIGFTISGGEEHSLPGWTGTALGMAAYSFIPIALANGTLGAIVGYFTNARHRSLATGLAALMLALLILRQTIVFTQEAKIVRLAVLLAGLMVAYGTAYLVGRYRDRAVPRPN